MPGVVLSFIGPGGHVVVTGRGRALSLPTLRVRVVYVSGAPALAVLAIILELIGRLERRGSPMDCRPRQSARKADGGVT